MSVLGYLAAFVPATYMRHYVPQRDGRFASQYERRAYMRETMRLRRSGKWELDTKERVNLSKGIMVTAVYYPRRFVSFPKFLSNKRVSN